MPIPDPQTLLLPVLKALADRTEHQVEEIRERMKSQFGVTPIECSQKNKTGTAVFVKGNIWGTDGILNKAVIHPDCLPTLLPIR